MRNKLNKRLKWEKRVCVMSECFRCASSSSKQAIYHSTTGVGGYLLYITIISHLHKLLNYRPISRKKHNNNIVFFTWSFIWTLEYIIQCKLILEVILAYLLRRRYNNQPIKWRVHAPEIATGIHIVLDIFTTILRLIFCITLIKIIRHVLVYIKG